MINLKAVSDIVKTFSENKLDIEFEIGQIRDKYNKLFADETKDLKKTLGEKSFKADRDINALLSDKFIKVAAGDYIYYIKVKSVLIDSDGISSTMAFYGKSVTLWNNSFSTEDLRTEINLYEIDDVKEITPDEVREQLSEITREEILKFLEI